MSAQSAAQWISTEVRDPETGHYRSGQGVIFRGAAIPQAVIESAVEHEMGGGWERLIVEVQHLTYHPRIKHCGNLDGFGCDLEGEWHSHWSGVRHNSASPKCCYTVALPVWEPSKPGPAVADAAERAS